MSSQDPPEAILAYVGGRAEIFGLPDALSDPECVEATDIPPEFSDDALATAFTSQHAQTHLYVASWRCWLRWDGGRWVNDSKLTIFARIRLVCRSAAARAERAVPGERGRALARMLASAKTVSAVEKLARADPRHARQSDEFDADPWILNTPAGSVDLHSGQLRPHRREDLFTKIAGAAPGERCDRWLEFLDQITQGNSELVSYLRRWIGYSLTGRVSEHAFVFLFGPGGNGKSVLVATVADMLGDYAKTAMSELFTVGRRDEHPTALAALRGARMVIVPETEAEHSWAEARLKTLTGGDRTTARVMRGDPFEFAFMGKIWIVGNHRPRLKHPDPAMRRRTQLLPLTYVPPAPDPTLADVLRGELPGILSWAIAGCLAWQRDGLNPPQVVRDAVAEYFADQDNLSAWFEDCCERLPTAQTPSRLLYTNWRDWSAARGEDSGSERAFSESLELFASKKRTGNGVVFMGIALRPVSADRAGWADDDPM